MNKAKFALYGLTVLGLIISNFIATPAFATLATDKSDVLTDSRPTVAANHTITFTLQNTWDAGETLTLTFNSNFDTSGFANTDPLDYDIEDDGSPITITAAGGCAADNIDITSIASDVFTFTLCAGSTSIASSSVIEIEIGTHATTGGTGNTQITNPSKVAAAGTADIYTTTLGGTSGTTGDILVAVQDGVTLSATVDETLTFTVAGTTTGTCTVAGGTEIDTSGDPTTIPFGTISSDAFNDACQQLTIGTNASGGYSTTVQTTSLPTSGGDTIAKGNCEGACSDSAEAVWDTAASFNGYGYCMDDTTGDGAATADAGWSTNGCQATTSSQFFKTIANAGAAETAVSVMASASSTTNNDVALIGYRLNVGSGQAAGSYQTVIVYITTPTF